MPIALSFALMAAAIASDAPEPMALAPAYQRLAELRAIAETASLGAAFDGAVIDRIEYVSTDLYRVTSGRCRIDIRIVGLPMPSAMVGPRRFEVRPGNRVCAQT